MKSTITHVSDIDRKWFVIDATDVPVGRLAVQIANVLRGRTKPTYTPHIDNGDFVVVINAEKVKFTGRKDDLKTYSSYTGFRGGLRMVTAGEVRAKHPERIIQSAVRGMLPKNRMNRKTFSRLKVYAGAEHPHAAQQPQTI